MTLMPDRNLFNPVIQEVGDELLVFVQGTGSAHSLNSVSTLVYLRCDGETTRASATEDLASKLGLSPEQAKEVLDSTLSQLIRQGLVASDEPTVAFDRRRFLAVAGAAVALPVVTSVFLPRPSAAVSICPTCTSCAQCGEFCSGTPPDKCGEVAPGIPLAQAASICNFEMRVKPSATPDPNLPRKADAANGDTCAVEFTGGVFLCRIIANPPLRMDKNCVTARAQIIASFGLNNAADELYYCCCCTSALVPPLGPKCC